MPVRCCLALAAILLLPGLTLAQPEEREAMRIGCDVDGVDLVDVMEQIGRQVGVNILVDPKIEETVRVNLRDIPWREAVDVIAKMTRCEVEERPGGILLLTRPNRITLSLQDTPAAVALARLASLGDVSLFFPADLSGSVSLEFKDTLWSDAMRTVASALGAHLQQRGSCLLVSPRELPAHVPDAAWTPSREGMRINVDVEDVALPDLLEQIGKHVKRPLVVDPSVKETIRVSLRDVPWEEAVAIIAAMTRCAVEELPGGVLLLTQPPVVTLDFSDTDVRLVLQLLAAYSGENLLLGADVRGSVTVHTRELDWRHALESVVTVCGLYLTDAGDAQYVTGRAPKSPGRVRGPRKAKRGGKAVAVDATKEDLADLMERIGKQVRRNILVDPNVVELVSVSLPPLDWRVAVDVIAKMTRCEVEERRGGILLLTQPPKVTIQASRAPADVLLRLLARYSGKNVVTGPGVGGLPITVDVKQVHWLRALHLIAQHLGLEVREDVEDGIAIRLPKGSNALGGLLPLDAPAPKAPAPTLYGRRVDALLEEIRALAHSAEPARVEAKLDELSRVVAAQSERRDAATAATPSDEAKRAEARAALDKQVEQVFAQIERLAQDRQVEGLIGKFTELRQLMKEHGVAGSSVVQRMLEKWRQRLAAFGEVQLSISLQIYINTGNLHLEAMAQAIRDDRFDAASAGFEAIKELKDQMYSEEREVFHRNAEALFLRGRALFDRAKRLKVTSTFVLDVSAIVVSAPDSDEKDSVILNGRVCYEGDQVQDAAGEPIENLSVVEIIRSAVRFRHEDTEFVRALQAP